MMMMDSDEASKMMVKATSKAPKKEAPKKELSAAAAAKKAKALAKEPDPFDGAVVDATGAEAGLVHYFQVTPRWDPTLMPRAGTPLTPHPPCTTSRTDGRSGPT